MQILTKEEIYNIVKQEILNLELEPGQRISEAEIAKRLGVSRQPIRELFIKLSHDHLVQVVPQKGTFISLIDLDYVKQVILMRYLIEKEVLAEACDSLTARDFHNLEGICLDQESYIEAGNTQAFLAADNQLHRTIFEICGHSVMWQIIESNTVNYSRFRYLDILEKEMMVKILEQHRNIIDLIKNKRLKDIDDTLSRHLYQGLDNSERILKRYKDYFKS